MVSRVYVEKKPGFDVEAQQLAHELRDILGIERLEGLRLVNRYDVEGITGELFAQCVPTVFSEPQSDVATLEMKTVSPARRPAKRLDHLHLAQRRVEPVVVVRRAVLHRSTVRD